MAFKDYFSGHAARYREFRPHYPGELFAWLAAQCSAHDLAWDAGCGNGQAAVALAEHFHDVFASDPSHAQVEHAEPHPDVQYRVEPAEQCGLSDRCADLAVIAQALHWVNLDGYYAEVRRVLKPGAVFAAWCYGLMRISPAIDTVVGELYGTVLEPYWPPERRHIETGYASLRFPFQQDIPAPPFAMRHEWSLDETLGYLESWSALQRYRKDTGHDPLIDFRPRFASAWGKMADARHSVVWPLSVRAGRI